MMQLSKTYAYHLEHVPIEPPPFRKVPNRADALLIKIETADGIVGWSMARHAHPEVSKNVYPLMAQLVNARMAPLLAGENPLLIERIWTKLQSEFSAEKFGGLFTNVMSALDIALWDIKGKALGLPVHHLLGGARDTVPVYITHGAAYGDAPVYSREELAAEAAHIVKQGNWHLKNTVGRQRVPDPDDDYMRMSAIREAVGPNVKLAMDANARMSVPQALRLCMLAEEIGIAFFEEPVYGNDPDLLADLKARTRIPISSAQRDMVSCRDLLVADAVDIIQPNANNDGGYSGALRIAAMARAFNKPLGHGNGAGPHNIAIQAAVPNGAIIEYHYHRWMTYNTIFKDVPQPTDGYLHVSLEPGVGLEPKPEVISEHHSPEL